jgi:hypothetical protein
MDGILMERIAAYNAACYTNSKPRNPIKQTNRSLPYLHCSLSQKV